MKTVTDNYQAYIIYLCKGHYKAPDFFEALNRLWAIRCGYNIEHGDKYAMEYIANEMYRIVRDFDKRSKDDIIYDLHRLAVKPDYHLQDFTPIQRILLYYKSRIHNIQIKEQQTNGNYKTLVKLPKPNKRILNNLFNAEPNEVNVITSYNELA